MPLKQIDYNSENYWAMVQLRYDMLRKPLGLKFSEEELELEANDIFIACLDEDEMLGCCILSPINEKVLRLRQMAVQVRCQGKGIGESIITFAENLSCDKGYEKIIMHSRDSAIGFYEKMGYTVTGQEFTEVNLPHHIMEKNICHK